MKNILPFLHQTVFPAVMLCCMTGCGSGQERPQVLSSLIPAKGTVTLDDKPLAKATITFTPQEGGESVRIASAVTDDNGVFELVTPVANMSPEESKGVAPGNYKVVISKYAMPDGSAVPPYMTDADAMAEGAQQVLPAKYSSYDNGSLVIEIERDTSPDKTYDFELKSK